MVDERMRQKLFPGTKSTASKPAIYRAKSLLQPWGLDKTPEVEVNPVYVDLPDLIGKNMKEHFDNMAYESTRKYLAMAETLARVEMPERPAKWIRQVGWTMYIPGETPKSVPYPLEAELVFDVEVAVTYGNYSVMAVAASSNAWYCWLSPFVISKEGNDKEFIPLGNDEKFVVGWNVSYDRARVAEAGEFEPNGLRFWDCMSMHISCVGLSSKQKNHYTSVKNKKSKAKEEGRDYNGFTPQWMDVTTTNSLKAAAEFYLGEKMDKNVRDIFVTGTRAEIIEKLDLLIDYNADDVERTHEIYQILWRRFRRHCPSDVTFAGMLIMGIPYLPVTNSWEDFKSRCMKEFNSSKDKITKLIDSLALGYIAKAKENNNYVNDPWLKNLDWELPGSRAKLMKTKPEWYRKVKKNKTQTAITSRARVVPYLLKMSWFGYPLLYTSEFGWGYLVDKDDSYETNSPNYNVEDYPNHKFYKLPHKDGEAANCGNPLAKDYLQYLESGTLRAEEDAAKEIVELAISISYWTSVQSRVHNQFSVIVPMLDKDGNKMFDEDGEEIKTGFILPQMLVAGTVTRRAVEPTWLTASNPKENRIGSEIKTVVRMPEGYYRLGADVDSQELWISDLLGDAIVGVIGGTPSGMQTLLGTKENGMDMHTVFAKDNGMARDGAKQCNYARRYGSGLAAQTVYMRQWIAGLSDADAKAKAKTSMLKTKGRKVKGQYQDGTESTMFNALERIATSNEPRTPFLGCAISDALTTANVGRDHMPSRVNWVVQSSGVDFLHCLLTAAQWLFNKYNVWAKFMISVHDEVHWIVKKEEVARAALLWQVAHIWTRAFFNYQVGFTDLPETVAWFSGVDIDFTWRKAPTKGCITPSNPKPLKPGCERTIKEIISKVGNKVK